MERPGVGLACIVMKLKEKQVLLGERIGSHGEGTLAFPGGHIELFEEYENCLFRELKEETGLTKDNIRLIDKFPVAATNDFFKEDGKHYITLFMRAEYVSGEVRVMEPKKCKEWVWIDWYKDFPNKVFVPIINLKKQNYDPFKNL